MQRWKKPGTQELSSQKKNIGLNISQKKIKGEKKERKEKKRREKERKEKKEKTLICFFGLIYSKLVFFSKNCSCSIRNIYL